MSAAKAEVIVDASIDDSEDDLRTPTFKQILNQTTRHADVDCLRWDDDSVIDALPSDFENGNIDIVWLPQGSPVFEKQNNVTKGSDAKTCNWTAPIWFTKEYNTSEVLCLKDVLVAACPAEGEDYGKTYVYVGLPEYVRHFLDLYLDGRRQIEIEMGDSGEIPHVFNDARVLPTTGEPEFWWRTTRSVKNLATTIATNEDGDVIRTSHSVADILKKTGKGFTITAYVKFAVCAKTTDGKVPDDSTIRTVSVDVLHGVLHSVNDNREGPVLAPAPSAVGHLANGMSTPGMGFVQHSPCTQRE